MPVKYGSYAAAAAALFPALSERLADSVEDPARLSGNIDDYLDEDDRDLTRDRLDRDAEAARIARGHQARGDDERAIRKWREVFGDRFPAYS